MLKVTGKQIFHSSLLKGSNRRYHKRALGIKQTTSLPELSGSISFSLDASVWDVLVISLLSPLFACAHTILLCITKHYGICINSAYSLAAWDAHCKVIW